MRRKPSAPAIVPALLAGLLASPAFAQDPPPPAAPPPAPPAESPEPDEPAGPWSGEIAAGFIATEGNGTTRSANAKVLLDYKVTDWKNAFQATSLHAADSEGPTAERYLVGDKLDYNFTPQNYVFGLVEYEKDLFGGIRERMSEVVGYGRHILPGPEHVLDAELGVGARQQKEQQTGLEESEVIGRAMGLYQWKFTDRNAFKQTVKVEGGESNTFTESVSELKLAVIGQLSAMASFTFRHNSDVPPGNEKADLVTTANLAYTFGKR